MTSDITELAQRMKAAAEKASNGDWVKESGDGWEACCSANDQANGGFIIAHFEGPDAAENRAFVQAANPANILALVEALEKSQDSGKVFQQSFFRQSLMYDVVAEAYEEAKEQIAKDVEIKARLCRESNSLFDRLRVAEKRIAELEAQNTVASLPGGFSIEESSSLQADLVRSHISKALSGEKMKLADKNADLQWIHSVIVRAAWFVKASVEATAGIKVEAE